MDIDSVVLDASQVGYQNIQTGYDYEMTLSKQLKQVFAEFDMNDKSIQSLSDIVQMRFGAEEGKEYSQNPRSIQLKGGRDSNPPGSGSGKRKETPISVGGDLASYPEELPETAEVLHSPDHKDSEIPGGKTRKKPGRKPKPKEEKPPGPGRGRKKGSKNRKTLERERQIEEGVIVVPPKKPVGRPRKTPAEDSSDKIWEKARQLGKERGIDLPEKRRSGRPSKEMLELLEEAKREVENES